MRATAHPAVRHPAVRLLVAACAAVLVVGVAGIAGVAGAAPDDPASRPAKNGDARRPRPIPRGAEVAVEPADGMKLAATWWAAGKDGGSGVVLLHEKGRTRADWEPFVEDLRLRDVAVLAIDLRGHGGSATQRGVDLAPIAREGAASFLSELHADVTAAARWLVREGRCDAKRIALVGAGLGGAVALDAAGCSPTDVAAVVCVSLPASPAGIDLAAAAKAMSGKVQVLLLAAGEKEAAAAAAVQAGLRGSRVLTYDGHLPARGPADPGDLEIWSREPLLRQTVASFVAAKTGSKRDDVVLDGSVERTGAAADPWSRATAIGRDGAESAWAYRVGERLSFGAVVPARARVVDLRVRLPEALRDNGVRWITIYLQSGGMRDLFGGLTILSDPRTLPEFRILRGPQTTTIEGEWVLGARASADDEIRVALRVDPVAGEPRFLRPAELGLTAAEVAGELEAFRASAGKDAAVVPSR